MKFLILYYYDLRYLAVWEVHQSGLSGIFIWTVCGGT